jgi:DNA-binding GntR family transcriptional regulator
MGTSQAPVREALRELEVLGIVESSKNRGTRICAPSPRELAEIYDVRAELEGYAASVIAGSFGGLGTLKDCIAEMTRCAERSDINGFAEANANFHRTIVAASGNQTLLDIWSRLDVKSRTTVNIVRTARDLKAVARSHQPIVRALESGNASQARSELRKHVLSYKPRVGPLPAGDAQALPSNSAPTD